MKPFSGFTTLLHHPNNPRSTAIEIVLNNQNNNIENGRDTQRVVLTKKQEIRLELARLGTKIDKMGLRTSTKKEDPVLIDKKSKSMETLQLSKDETKQLKKEISTYTLNDNTKKLNLNKEDESKSKNSLDDGINKRKFSFFNKLKNKSSNKNLKNSLKSKKSNTKIETALSEVENAVERMMLSRLDDQRVTIIKK
ncbi:hypothetical protein LY90DRAFT_704039 [Neocallimastix californiae]|jgi:hypothetical protein|uniref:Uncharacterized protein n=1 Tax=Neocallimastix californiae TaxID=1754190 RepID=A0A1Y2C2Q2_9FUNG|nr:hypothetical protein LY90DRAFT_704039 [Neocallimastix californiae]|eukprot:ORY41164.1 hypothetical protein LY90DRAFT_704039 [Neocallimastix californiae]